MSTTTLAPAHLTKFIKFLGHERFCIKSIETGIDGAQEAHFDLINANKAVDYITVRNENRQLWTNVQRFKKGTKGYHDYTDVEAYTNVFLDIDASKPDDRKDYAATDKERGFAVAQLPTIQNWLDGQGFKPGLAIKSGNGGGLLLPIPPTPPGPEFIAKVAAFLKLVKDETNCDVDTTTFDPPRVCGVLGTWNAKFEDEAEGRKNHLRESIGDIPTRDEDTALLRYIERLEPDRATLATWTKKYNEPAKPKPEAKKGPTEGNADVDADFVKAKLDTLLEADPKLQNLLDWSEDEQERHGGDRSNAEFGLVGKLTAAGFSDPQIDWVMCHVSKIGKWAEDGKHYQEMTLRKIRGNDADEARGEGQKAAKFKFADITTVTKEDEKGNPTKWKFSPAKAAKAALKKLPILTTRGARAKDPLTTWAYDATTGLFREDGEFRIKAALNRAAGDLFTLNAARETIAKIQYESIGDRDELDCDPYLLPVENAVIDLRNGAILDYSPDLKLTSKLPVKYDPKATCPRILRYTSESLADPMGVLTVIDMFAAMSIRDAFDAFMILLGQGGNGKEVLEYLTEHFLGSDQITAVRLENLGRNQFSVGELIGKRALINSEVSGSERESDWMKRIASGDQCDTDIKHGGHVLFRPYCLQIFDCNNPPQFYDNSFGLARRFWKLDFPYKFVDNPDPNNPYEKKKDPKLKAKITTDEELSGLLNLIIARAPDVIESGTMYRRGDGTEMFTEYTSQARNMESFVNECCDLDLDDYATHVATDELLEAYKRYCERWNVSAQTANAFGRYITKVTKTPSVTENGIRYRHFIELKETASKNRLEQIRTDLEQNNQQQEQIEQITSLYLKEIVKGIIGKKREIYPENPIDKQNLENGPQSVLSVLASGFSVLDLFSIGSNMLICSETEERGEDVGRPSYLADEPGNTSTIERPMPEAKAKRARRLDRINPEPVRLKDSQVPAFNYSKNKAKEYAPISCNLYGNCSHKCEYCFVEPAKYDRYKKSSLPAIEKSLKSLDEAGERGPVHLSFYGDPYERGRDTSETRAILELFGKYPVNFQILTKGGTNAVRDFDLYRPGDRFGCTLTFLDPEKSKAWEPGAALPEDRIQALKEAHERGIETWASFEPVLDPSETLKLIKEVSGFVDIFAVGKLNASAKNPKYQKHKELENSIDWEAFAKDAVELLESLGATYYIKADLRKYEPEAKDNGEGGTLQAIADLGATYGALSLKGIETHLGDSKKARYYFGLLESKGWKKEKLKSSGLVVLRPPPGEGALPSDQAEHKLDKLNIIKKDPLDEIKVLIRGRGEIQLQEALKLLGEPFPTAKKTLEEAGFEVRPRGARWFVRLPVGDEVGE